MSRQAVFLDRDGVLNQTVIRNDRVQSPRTVDEVLIIDTAIEACRVLSDAGFLLIGVTNQPDVSRGIITREFIEAINDTISNAMGLDALYYCPHDDRDNCLCRKPKAGMLIEGASIFDIDLKTSIMVGDRGKDIDAGHAAGCQTVLIDLGYNEQPPPVASITCNSLLDAVPWILDQKL